MDKINLLIADDEDLECAALADMAAKHFSELVILPFARDGVELVEGMWKFHPDIVVADINMPLMNGLDALSSVREDFPRTKIIIVTAYSQFSFAKQALLLHSCDYILKPVQPDEFISSLGRAVKAHRDEAHSLVRTQELQRARQEYWQTIEEDFVLDIINGQLRKETVRRMLGQLGHPFYGGVCAVYVFSDEDSPRLFEVRARGREDYFCMQLIRQERLVCCFVAEGPVTDEQAWISQIRRDYLAAHRQERVLEEPADRCGSGECSDEPAPGRPVMAAFGGFKKTVRELADSYREAILALQEKSDGNDYAAGVSEADPFAVNRGKFLRLLSEERIQESAALFQTVILSYPPQESRALVRAKSVYFLYRLGTSAASLHRQTSVTGRDSPEGNRFSGSTDRSIPQGIVPWGYINRRVIPAGEKEPDVSSLILLFQTISGGSFTGMKNPVVRQAAEYMRNHYAEDISLQETAQHCAVNPSYLSRRFTQELKANFVDILTDIRMEQALCLLADHNLSAQAISESIGYPNTNYFYKVFKKTVGVSLAQMRDYIFLLSGAEETRQR